MLARQEPWRQDEQMILQLLIRWHRWTADPMRSSDTAMRAFDDIIGKLRPCYRVALILEARELACGAAIMSRVLVLRSEQRTRRQTSRKALCRAIAKFAQQWTRVISYNEHGRRIGESNPKARLTDHEVDLIRELYEERTPDGARRYSFGQIALKTRQPKSTVSDICYGRRRAQIPARVKEG